MQLPSISLRTLVAVALCASATARGTNMLQYHNDALSTGVNPAESQLTPGVVSGANGFGLKQKVSVDGYVYAQPLYKADVTVPSGSAAGVHNLAFIATQHDSLYAIDTDTGVIVWKDAFATSAFGLSGVTSISTVSPNDVGSMDTAPEIGICSTPVIDPTTNLLYVVAKTRQVLNGDGNNPHFVYNMYAVDIATGTISRQVLIGNTIDNTTSGDDVYTYRTASSPTALQDPYTVGTGEGAITVGGQSRVYFNALREFNRCGLTLSNGVVYVAFASHGDNGPYHGFILGYDKSTLALSAVFNASPNGRQAGFWNCGSALPVDAAGDLYAVSGNGVFDGNNTNGNVTGLTNGFPSNADYGDCVMRITRTNTTISNPGPNGYGLAVADYFAPYNNQTLSGADTDLGSGGCTLLPASAGSSAHQDLLVVAGKQGVVYLIDRANMGKFGTADNVVQELSTSGSFATPSFFNGELYYVGYSSKLQAFTISNAVMTSVANQSPDTFSWPGATVSISANGTSQAIVWALERTTMTMRAYDPANLSTELYKTSNVSSDVLDSVTKFTSPTVVDGKVLVATTADFYVYGLASQSVAVAPPIPVTGAASQIGTNGATLAGTVNPKGTSTSAQFQYGTDTTYGSQSNTVNAGSSSTVQNVSVTIANLTPATLYHYQLFATNTGTTVYGADKTFTTAKVPVVTTPATAAISASGAQISVAINPEGMSTTFYVQYSTDNSFNLQTASQTISGSSPVNLFATLPSLAAGTTYQYRVVTTTANGTIDQTPQTFTTLPFDTTLTASTGDGATGVTNGTFASFGNPATNASGHSAFRGVLGLFASPTAGLSITSSNNVGIWADDVSGNRQLVARTGTANAPGVLVAAPFTALADPAYNANSAVAFTGALKVGTGLATTATSTGIWTNASGTGTGALALVAQAGTQAPGCPSLTNFANFVQIALSDAGGVSFLAHTVVNPAVDSTASSNLGIWADDSSGNLQLIVRTGDVVNGKTVTNLAFLPAMPTGATAYGNARSVAPGNGNLTYLATFSDKTTAIMSVNFQ